MPVPAQGTIRRMNIVILDDYQDAVRKLNCAEKLDAYPAKVYTNTVKGIGQLSVRLRDADVIVLIRERTQITRQLVEKLPRLKLIAQTGRVGTHIDVAACTERGIAVAEGVGSPVAPAELTWALIMAATRRLPQYIRTLKHCGWRQSGLRSASMPPNFGLGTVLRSAELQASALPEEDRPTFAKLIAASTYKDDIAGQIAKQQLIDAGTAEPTQEQIGQAAATVWADFVAKTDITIDPRFGLAADLNAPQDGSVSYPVSKQAKSGDKSEGFDIAQDAQHALTLPGSMRCTK